MGHDARSVAGEPAADGAPDAARGTGDERDFSFESHGCKLLCSSRVLPAGYHAAEVRTLAAVGRHHLPTSWTVS